MKCILNTGHVISNGLKRVLSKSINTQFEWRLFTFKRLQTSNVRQKRNTHTFRWRGKGGGQDYLLRNTWYGWELFAPAARSHPLFSPSPFDPPQSRSRAFDPLPFALRDQPNGPWQSNHGEVLWRGSGWQNCNVVLTFNVRANENTIRDNLALCIHWLPSSLGIWTGPKLRL